MESHIAAAYPRGGASIRALRVISDPAAALCHRW